MKKILKAVKMFAASISFLFVIGTNSYGQSWGNISQGFETGVDDNGSFIEKTYSLTSNRDIVNFGQTLFTDGAWKIITVDGNSKKLRGSDYNGDGTIAGFKIDAARTINIKNLSFFDFSNIVDEDGKSGGVVYIEGSSIMTFSGTVNFLTNTASLFGGVILSTGGASIIFNNASSKFTDNTAERGGVFANLSTANVIFNNSKIQITNNVATVSGGVFFTEDAITKFNDSELDITNNYANVMGGAIYAENFSTITFSNSIVNFTTNSASDGGAIYANSSSFSFSKSTIDFRYNEARQGSGGAIYLQSSTITINNANTYFINNTALNGDGGAISIKDSDLLFKNSVAVFANNEATNGGAIAVVGNSNLVLENIDFVNNEATNGGAIYISGDDAKMIIRATNGNVSFIGNKAGSTPNDIYMDGASELELNVADKSQIIMNGGMTVAAASTVKKTGRGGVLLNTDNTFAGSLIIVEGSIKPTTNFDIETLNIGTNGLILINEKSPVEITAGQLTINGNVNIGFDIEEWVVSDVNATTIEIVTGSTLTVTDFWYGEVDSSQILIMQADNPISGQFSWLVFNEKKISVELDYETPNAVYLTINRVSPGDVDLTEFTELTKNQEKIQTLLNKISVRNAISNDVRFQIANLIDTGRISEAQQALESLNGAFFANLLTVGAINNNFAAMHTRINTINEKQSQEQNPFSQNEGENEHQIWVQGNINGVTYSKETNAANEFKSNKLEIQTGIDVFRDESGLFGVYFGYGNSSLEQGKDSADVVDTEIGFYGGWFGSNLSFIGTLSGGLQKFNTKRDIKIAQFREKPEAEFDTYSLRYTLDLEYLVNMDGYSLVKPFIGVEGGVVFSNKVEENSSDGIVNLVVNSDRYVRLTGLLGVKVEGQKNRWSYYGKLYEGYLILGDKPKYTVSFKSSPESGEIEIEGSEEKTLITGLGLGARYAITKNISAYVNSDIRASLNTFGYFFSGGFGYKFGKFYSAQERKEYLEAVREAETEDESVEE